MVKTIDTELQQLNDADTDRLSDLFNRAFDSTKGSDFFRWKYFDNPAGPIIGYGASHGDRLVASHGNIPVHIQVGEQVVAGAQSVDAMVAAEARRQGMWARIARASYVDMDRDGYCVNYCLPSPVAKIGFVEKLGWIFVGDVPRYVKPLDLARLVPDVGMRPMLKRLLWHYALWQDGGSGQATSSDVQIDRVVEFDERFGRLWTAAAANFKIAVVRDANYLNWRYVDHPQAGNYVRLSAEIDGQLSGYVVLSRRDPDVTHLLELVVDPAHPAAADALLDAAVRHAQEAGAAQLQALMLPHHRRYIAALQRFGFIHAKGRLVPGELGYCAPFIVRLHPDQIPKIDPTDLRNWFISMGDHDYY